MKREKKLPKAAVCILGFIILACAFAPVLAPFTPDQMDSSALNAAPGGAHLLGTDALGRDLLSMLLYGGQASIYIGLLSGLISTVIAVVYGTVSGLCSEKKQRSSDAVCRTLYEHTVYPFGHLFSGTVGKADGNFSCGDYRPDRLDEYFQDCQKRSAPDCRQ